MDRHQSHQMRTEVRCQRPRPGSDIVTPPIDFGRACADASDALRDCLHGIQRTDDPSSFLDAVHRALQSFGITADRLNLPASRVFGFRHPLYGIALTTWYVDRPNVVNLMDHQQYNKRLSTLEEALADSPYRSLILEGAFWYRAQKNDGRTHPVIVHEIFDEGYNHYTAIGLKLSNGLTQPLGMAATTPFPNDLEDRLAVLVPLLAMSIEAFYARYAAFHVVRAYVGPNTGPRALDGSFSRGTTDIMRAGILFCDIRNSTAMAEDMGFLGTVPIFNQIFEAVGEAVERYEGEILKFIGDALLIIFPAPEGACRLSLADRMVRVVDESVEAIRTLADTLGHPLAIGFGGHVGDVLYGNIGTPERLDFTVMGPAVNLASRLESLSKTHDMAAVFSEEVGLRHDGLDDLGKASLKGIADPVKVYGFPNK